MYKNFIVSIIFLLFFMASHFSVNAQEYAAAYTKYRTKKEDNLYEVARRFDVGIVELLSANPNTDPWMPAEGTELFIPTVHILPERRGGIVINLAQLRMFFFADDGQVFTFPIGVGREGWQTPTGITKIIGKKQNPDWIPPPAIRKENPQLPEIVPAGEDNPLGDYAMYLGWRGYLIHSTNRPYGVGKRSSHGCIRMYPEDIEFLFDKVRVGTQVTVIEQPYSIGWRGDLLFLEVSHSQSALDEIAEYKVPKSQDIPEIYAAIRRFIEKDGRAEIDWYRVEEAVAQRTGLPVVIGKKI